MNICRIEKYNNKTLYKRRKEIGEKWGFEEVERYEKTGIMRKYIEFDCDKIQED